MRSTGQFSRHFVTLTSDVSKFGQNLDSGRMKLGQYFRTWQGHTQKTSSLVRDLAKQQVMLENAIIQPIGKNAQGLMQYNVMVQSGLDVTKNKSALLRQELAIMNKVMMDGSNQLINWGKNTQWAGRQLTVGLTVPLAAFGMAAAKAFRQADEELVRLTKVYGGLTATSSADLLQVRRDVMALSRELASGLGANFTETIALAADIAATGKEGADLLDSTRQTTRLAILGEVDRQEAMKATLSIQTAFGQNTMELAESIDFLNAVENQTSTTLEDLVTAIPKAGPVVKALGGDVQDLALYLTAMREGGINASEGANALKSALASVINPTKVAKEMFMGFGIDLSGIVNKNAGNLTGTIMALKDSLDSLEPLQRARAIEQLFGKFQFARINALFENLGKEGSQTLQVLDLMKASTQDLASISERELKALTESASGKYRRALESVKAELAGVGEQFLKVGAFVLNAIDGILKFIGNLPAPIKAVLGFIGGLTAIAGPIIMLTGVLANFFGYIIKGVLALKNIGKGGTGFKLLTPELMAASAAAKTVEQSFYSDTKAAATFSDAVLTLAASFDRLKASAMSATVATSNGISTVGGSTVLAGGGRIVDKDNPLVGKPYSRDMSHVSPTGSKTPQQRADETIFSTVPGPKPVNLRLSNSPQTYMTDDLPRIHGVTAVNGVSNGIVASEAAKWHSMTAAIAMQSKAELAILKTEVAATGTITASLADSYQALLPQMTRITTLAADETALIVQQLQAGKITVEAARAKIFALNAQVEAMMVQTAQGVAAAQARTISLTTVPLTSQPVVNPITGKSNMKELFHKTETAKMVDAIARGLGVRTSGAGYSIQTTKPRFNTGGKVEAFGANKTRVTGPASITYDDRMGDVPLGGYVLNQAASMDPRNAPLVAAAPSTYREPGKNITALLTPQETVFGAGIQNNPELFRAVDAANNGVPLPQHAAGGKINLSRSTYGAPIAASVLRPLFNSNISAFRKRIAEVAEQRNKTRIDPRGRDTQIIGSYGRRTWVTRGASTNAAIDDYLKTLPPSERRKAAKVIEEFSASIETTKRAAERGAPRGRDAFAIEAGHLKPGGALAKKLEEKELPPLDLDKIIHATHLTRAVVINGKRYVSKYTVDYDSTSNLQANQGTLLAKDFLDRNMGRIGKYDRLMRKSGVPQEKWADTEKEIDQKIQAMLKGKEAKKIGDEKGDITFDSFIPLIDSSIVSAGGSAAKLKELQRNVVERKNAGGVVGGKVKPGKFNYGRLFLGMPKTFKQVAEQRKKKQIMEETTEAVNNSRFANLKPTNFGKKEEDTTGHSFPVDGIGGLYTKPDGSKVFVKPVLDEKAALAETRYNAIHNDGHLIGTPQQQIRVMIDPTDPTGKRKVLVLESPYDKKFASMPAKMDEDEYFAQLLASSLRGDKDLSKGNIGGRRVSDAGTSGVFKTASGLRDYADDMPSVAEQARINLLGVKGSHAKKFFAESTVDIPRGMTAQQYHLRMLREIDETLPRVKDVISRLGLNDAERPYYDAIIKRLEDARGVDWTEFHGIHSAVKPTPPKALTPAALKKLQEEAERRIRQRGHAISLSDNSFKTSLNGFNGGGIIGNILKSLAMRRIGAGFGPTGAPKPSMYESAPWGVSSLSIKAAETLFASTGLRKHTQKLLYDKFAAALAKEKPYGYVKGPGGELRNALEPSSLDSVIRQAASDLISDRSVYRQLSPIDRDILKKKYLNFDTKKETPVTEELKKKIFGIDGKREMGGPVSPGQNYLVGENGPELFSPQQSGKIIPGFTLGGLIRRSKDFYGQKLTDVSQVSSKEHAKRLLRSGDPSQRAIGQLWLDNDKASRMPAAGARTAYRPGPLSVESAPIVGNKGVITQVPKLQGSLPYAPALALPLRRFNTAIDTALSSITNGLRTASNRLIINTRMIGDQISSSLKTISDGTKKFGSAISSTASNVVSSYKSGGSQILAYGVPGANAEGVGRSYGPASDATKTKRAGTAFLTNARYSSAALLHPLQYLKTKGIGSDPDRPLGSGAGGMLIGTMGGMAAGGAIGKAIGGEQGTMMGSMVGMMAGPAIMQGAGKLVASMAAKSVSAGVASAGLGATAAGIAGLVAPIAALTAAVYGGYKAFKHYKEGQTLNISTFGMTAEAAKKANLRFTDFGSKIKETIQDSKDMAAANKLVYESMKDGGTPFQMTIAEYKKLKVEVKETFAEQIKALDRQPSNKVPDAVRRIKEQLIAAGMSADEATKKVFTMLQLSNKKDQSITATIGNNKFKAITDPQSAAVSAVTSFGKDTRDQGSKERAASLNTALMATETGINDLIAKRERLVAKDLTGKTKSLTYAEAEKIMLDKINRSKEAGTAITQATVDEMAKTNPEVRKMINGSDTVVSVWQKIRLQAQGFNGDLSQLNAAQTKLIADSFAAISDAVIAKNKVGILKDQYIALGKLDEQIKKYTKSLKGQSAAEQISDRDRVKALNKQIDAINKLAEARKKALTQQQADADLGRQIEKTRLEIQNAVAVGDTEKAQSLRIDLESLTSQQQTEAQMNAIDKAAEAATKPLKAAADAIANKQEKLGDAAAIAAESLDKLKDKYSKQEAAIKKVNDSMTALYGNAAAAGLSVKDYMKKNKEAAAGFVAAMEAATGAAMPRYKERTYYNGSQLVTEKVPVAPWENALEALAKAGAGAGVNEALADSIKGGKNGKTLKDVVDAVKGINGKPALRENIKVTGDYSDSKETKEYDGKKVQVLNAEARDAIRKRLDLQPGETFIVDGQRYKQNTTGGTPIWMGPAPKTPALAAGGHIRGAGTGTSDSIPAYLSNGEYVIKEKAVRKYGVETFDALNAEKFADGGPVRRGIRQQLPFFPWRPDLPNYWSDGKPTGSPYTGRWGELRYNPSSGRDIWGGTEIPGLKFTGKTPQQSDYWHQMQEQPGKSRGPGMGIDKDPMRLAGSGASMGGIGNGAYGFGPLMFHAGGPVGHRHGRNAPTTDKRSNLSKTWDFLKEAVKETGRSADWLYAMYQSGQGSRNPFFLSQNNRAKFQQIQDLKNAGLDAEAKKALLINHGLSSLNVGSLFLGGAVGSAAVRGAVGAYGINRLGVVGLETLLPTGSLTYGTKALTGVAANVAATSSKSILESRIASTVRPKVAASADEIVPPTRETAPFPRTKEVQDAIDEAKKWNTFRENEFKAIEEANPDYLQLHKLLVAIDEETHALKMAGGRYWNETRGPIYKSVHETPGSPDKQLFDKHSKNDDFWKYHQQKYKNEIELDRISRAEKYNITPGEVLALREFLEMPLTGHLDYRKSGIEQLVSRFTIPEGTVSYRGLSDIDMEALSKIGIGESFVAPTVRSITDNKIAAAAIGAFGGTGGGRSGAIARIIFGPNVKGISDIGVLGEAQGLSHEGLIGPNTRFILEQIIRGGAQSSRYENQAGVHMMNIVPGQGKIITETLDEYVLRAVKMKLGGLVNVPKFESGINVVPQDMLAMIHKNESIIPASMNPFNPEAAMPRYNFDRPSFGIRGEGSSGASYTVNQNIYASEGMDVEALSNMIVKKAEVVIGQKAKVNVKMVGQGKNI
jgi:TP901 family phage tail tape measure protein